MQWCGWLGAAAITGQLQLLSCRAGLAQRLNDRIWLAISMVDGRPLLLLSSRTTGVADKSFIRSSIPIAGPCCSDN